jgi:hypothetical protein
MRSSSPAGGIPVSLKTIPNGSSEELEEGQLDIALQRVRAALIGLAYGTVTITVHDGSVVQVERSEKMRFEQKRKR